MLAQFMALIVPIMIGMAVFILFFVIVMWKIFKKAGYPGWASLVPIYNLYIALKIAGLPGWTILLTFVPVVNIIIIIIMPFGTAKNFGKGFLYGLGMFLLPLLFYPLLDFSDAEYVG